MNKDFLTIGQFAEKSGVNRKNLIYYDQIDLLKPAVVNEKGYRFYDYHQLYRIHLILALKDIGISLKKIKEYTDSRNVQKLIDLLTKQREHAQERVIHYSQMLEMLDGQLEIYRENIDVKFNQIQFVSLPEAKLFFEPSTRIIPNFRVSTTISDFYKYCIDEGFTLPYPTGMVLDFQNPEAITSRYYAKIPQASFIRPEGNYLVIYFKGYQQFAKIRKRIFDFAQEHHFKLKKQVYLDFVSNELIEPNFEQFLFKMMIPVL